VHQPPGGARGARPLHPLRPTPVPSPRPWAGRRLSADGSIGELWVAGPASVVDAGPLGRVSLDELAAAAGEALVGARGMRLMGARFPLLVKLIDAADWLSLQVHPTDAVAAELYGPGTIGKSEAWVVLDAQPGAALVTGPRPDLPGDELLAAIAAGRLDRGGCEEHPCTAGDAWLVPAGTIHAIGAGTFVYEIEQPSDLTFRISDWGRPPSAARPLHPAEALRAVRPDAHALRAGRSGLLDGGMLELPELRLEAVETHAGGTRHPAGQSVEVVTVVRGRAELRGDGWQATLEPFETLVVPASVEAFAIGGPDAGLALVGSVP
jgi:mannose-6-phosphate isomerase